MTIVELMISMTVFSLIMITVISAVQAMMVGRVKSLNRITLIEQLYFFSEQLFTEIKNGGTIDYEEYWNRHAMETPIGSGHYTEPSGVGNYGGGVTVGGVDYGAVPYLCRSGSGTSMGTGGCLTSNNDSNTPNQARQPQRYGQYALQFWDYNGNRDGDGWDQDGDGRIVGDEDDYSILNGPVVFTGAIPELYLIDKQENTRTYFRWFIQQDPNAPSGVECSITWSGVTSSGCLGNIQMLKLKGYDAGWQHTNDMTSSWAFDGVIDTWVCDQGWSCAGSDAGGLGNVATGQDQEWINLFPSSINVKNLKFDLAPNKDPWLAVAAPDCGADTNCQSPFIHPYVRFTLEIGFAQGKRRALRGDDPTISVSTTVSLDDFR